MWFFNFLPSALFVECLLLCFLLKNLTNHTWSKGDLSRSLPVPAKLWSVWPEKKKTTHTCQSERDACYIQIANICAICSILLEVQNDLARSVFHHHCKWHTWVTQKEFKTPWQGSICPPASFHSNYSVWSRKGDQPRNFYSLSRFSALAPSEVVSGGILQSHTQTSQPLRAC